MISSRSDCPTVTKLSVSKNHEISIFHSFNTHETVIAEENDDDSGDKVKVRRIGRATNPTLALINHSCDPNYRDGKYAICNKS